ncbi:unnamed protein product [Larinioides sclopetarius]|uniref:MADF domain-containing protein n=1 Tax=Larinioides sclopetarius TaxID=280406 RepID=A0AAV2B686_9ARAC
MRFSDEQTWKFVGLLEEHECLWNNGIAQCRNRQLRDRAVAAIAKNMAIADFTTRDVKLKIKSLRSTYQSEVAKIQRSLRSGTAQEDVYVPTIRWFDLMDSFMKQEESTENRVLVDESLVDDPVSLGEEGASTPQFLRRPPSKKRKHAELLEAAAGLKAMAVRLPGVSSADEFDHLGELVTEVMKKLRPDLAIETRDEIMSVCFKYQRLNLRAPLADITAETISAKEAPVERDPLSWAMEPTGIGYDKDE